MKLLKIAILALLLLTVASLGGTLFLYHSAKTELSQEKQLRAQAEQEKANTEKELEKTKLELSQVRDARDQMAKQLEDEVRLAREFSQKYEQEKTKSGGLESQFSDLRQQKEALEKQLKSIKDELQAKIEALLKENESLKNPSGSTGSPMVDAATGVATSSGSTVNLPAVQVTPERTPRVVLVNDQYKFVVVNIGQADGLKIGDVLNIMRNKEGIARVKVSKFYDSMAACDIDWLKDGVSIQQGDSVAKA